jgi:tetratricopeptide (TPR) repeat protein
VALSRAGQYEKSITVVTLALRLAPKDSDLLHNRKLAWTEFAAAALKAGRDAEAVAIVRRAAAEGLGKDFEAVQADLYCRQGEQLIKAGKWEQALAVAERGLGRVDAKPREALRKWRAGVFLRWAAAERRAARFEEAAAILEKGLAAEPKDADFPRSVNFLARQWATAAAAKDGIKGAAVVFQKLHKRFGKLPELKQAAGDYVYEVLQKPLKDGQYEDALATVEDHDTLLTDKNDAKKLTRMVYDTWAGSCRKNKDWQEAVAVYARGLKKFPRDGHLENNLVATYDAWAQTFMKVGNWAAAVGVYEKALAQLPKDSHLSNNLKYCKNKMKE